MSRKRKNSQQEVGVIPTHSTVRVPAPQRQNVVVFALAIACSAAVTLGILLLSERRHISNLEADLAQAKAAPQPVPIKVAEEAKPVAHGRTIFDHLRAQAEEMPGAKEALWLVEQAGGAPIDVLKIDCLVARDIPECRELKYEICDDF